MTSAVWMYKNNATRPPYHPATGETRRSGAAYTSPLAEIMKQTVNSFLQHLVVERGFSQNTLDAYSNDLNQFRVFVADSLNSEDQEVWR